MERYRRGVYNGNMGYRTPCDRNMSPYRPNNGCGENACYDHEHEHEHDHDHHEDMCDRDDYSDDLLGRFPIGMCYVPWQRFQNLYENEFAALAHGTLFKELDLEFCGRSCK
ncbi:MAG: hypothetical protein K0S47_976 [Herbinix sp.]|nr:hypothetical protein [Herbinix sp.]